VSAFPRLWISARLCEWRYADEQLPCKNQPVKSQRLRRMLAVVLGAGLLCRPALFNRYPFFYPDSLDYIAAGSRVARALFLHRSSDFYGLRSLFYSLAILPLHWERTPWPIVFGHALLIAYLLWLVARSLLPRPLIGVYLLLMVALSIFTGLGWFVSRILPDILAPALVLAVFLLAFCWESLARAERCIVTAVAWLCIVSHASHLLLAAALCLVLTPVFLLQGRKWFAVTARIALIMVVGIAAQLALNWYLNGRPSLNGERPPFLAVRVISDGPGRWYLRDHCNPPQFAICKYLSIAGDDSDPLLWTIADAPEDEQQQILHEEMPLVLATVRTYPRQQLAASLRNFWRQLYTFDLDDFGADEYVKEHIGEISPGIRESYLRSRQAHDDMPIDLVTGIQLAAVIVSLIVILLAAGLWRRIRSWRLTGLSWLVALALLANAAITGVLSTVEDRYQGRMIWLVPLLTGFCVTLAVLQRRAPRITGS
jgi:hypothetical protein